jgi:hypothetical protein
MRIRLESWENVARRWASWGDANIQVSGVCVRSAGRNTYWLYVGGAVAMPQSVPGWSLRDS